MGGVILLGLLFVTIFYLVLRLIRKPAPPPSAPGRDDVVLRLDERRPRREPPQPLQRPDPEDSSKPD